MSENQHNTPSVWSKCINLQIKCNHITGIVFAFFLFLWSFVLCTCVCSYVSDVGAVNVYLLSWYSTKNH